MTASTSRTISLRRRTVLATAIAAIWLAGAANAHADFAPVDLQAVDRETGQPLRVWRHDGRLFVAGEPGERYGLRVTNHTDHRVMVVMSVDGVNIVTGETANYSENGYVLDAHESYDVTGWRKSTTEVAAFTFAPLPQSYAARTGRPADVGVIGMAVFNERVVVPPAAYVAPEARPESDHKPNRHRRVPVAVSVFTGSPPAQASAAAQTRESLAAPMPAPPPPPSIAPTAPSADVAAPAPADVVVDAERRDERLGTAHGAREWSAVTMVDFERATPYPQFVRQIQYDTHDNLVASGVIPAPRDNEHRPDPFPSRSGEEGFVPDPPG